MTRQHEDIKRAQQVRNVCSVPEQAIPIAKPRVTMKRSQLIFQRTDTGDNKSDGIGFILAWLLPAGRR